MKDLIQACPAPLLDVRSVALHARVIAVLARGYGLSSCLLVASNQYSSSNLKCTFGREFAVRQVEILQLIEQLHQCAYFIDL